MLCRPTGQLGQPQARGHTRGVGALPVPSDPNRQVPSTPNTHVHTAAVAVRTPRPNPALRYAGEMKVLWSFAPGVCSAPLLLLGAHGLFLEVSTLEPGSLHGIWLKTPGKGGSWSHREQRIPHHSHAAAAQIKKCLHPCGRQECG